MDEGVHAAGALSMCMLEQLPILCGMYGDVCANEHVFFLMGHTARLCVALNVHGDKRHMST
jgi:hypothetical protein